MLILLPPSEGKAERRRGSTLDLQTLSSPSLNTARAAVLSAAAETSRTPGAASVLKVSPGLSAEIRRNTELWTSPTLPAARLYTGVLYDALDLDSLDPASRRRANARIMVTSAMFGVVRLTDRIPPYRLSMGVNLPGVGPLARFWREPLVAALADLPRRGVVLDTRSSTYAAAWAPTPGSPQADGWTHVTVPGATHMAKYTRGLVARAVVRSAAEPSSPRDLADLLSEHFEVSLAPPSNGRSPWLLSALQRGSPERPR